MIKNAHFAVISFLLGACAGQSTQKSASKPIEQLSWLIGTWKNEDSTGTVYEIWTKEDENHYQGLSCMVAKGDTVFSEQIELMQDDDLYYIPTVSNQNNGESVKFKLVSNAVGEFVFENKEHDFPQRIIYPVPQGGLLRARIEGTDNGKFRREEFVMRKEKE